MSDISNERLHSVNENELTLSNWSLSNVIKEVMQTMTGISVAEEKVTLETIKDFHEQLSGVIMLLGSKKIMISLTTSYESAYAIVESMTGLPKEELKHTDLIDSIAELANIVAGKVKAVLAANGESYQASLPYSITGDNHCIIHKNRTVAMLRKYYADKIGVLVRVFVI